MIFGGTPGIRAIFEWMKREGIKRFPKRDPAKLAFSKLIQRKDWPGIFKEHKIKYMEIFLKKLKDKKKHMKMIETFKNPEEKRMMQELGEQIDPTFKHLEDVDQDIAIMEKIIQKKQGRKLQASGGRVSYTKGGLAHVLGV